MPNLCSNLLTIKSRNKRLLEEIKNIPYSDGDEGLLGFFRPMPEEIKSRNPGDTTRPNKQEFTQKYGADNWYDWSNKYWGTKWDVKGYRDCSLISLDDDVWMLDIEFETAWNPPVEAIEFFVKHARETIDSMSEDEVLPSITLQYIEPGEQFCGIYDFLNRSESFEIDFTKDDFPNSNLDYIWLEEEVEAEKAYQKEMDEEWKEESCS
jgi:hypothetical protein